MHASLKHLLAAGALVLGAAACDIDPEQAPPFSPSGTGKVTGQVFFDSDGNGVFDPVRGDDLLSGATVTIAERGDSTRVLASTTTDANGAFSLESVPVGTHELRATATNGTRFTCAPIAVTVYVAEPAFTSAGARLSCRIDIVVAEARTLSSTITVGGIVTARPGVYRNNNLYLQDATGGMQAFNVPGGTGIVEGDSVELTGPLGAFNQELQFSSVGSYRIVSRDRPFAPRVVTIPQLRAEFAESGNRSRSIGELIEIKGARIILPAQNTAGSGTDGRIVVGTDELALRLDVNVNTNVTTAQFVPNANACYDVRGILGQFSSTLQIKPRSAEDRTEVPCPTR